MPAWAAVMEMSFANEKYLWPWGLRAVLNPYLPEEQSQGYLRAKEAEPVEVGRKETASKRTQSTVCTCIKKKIQYKQIRHMHS